MLGEKGWSWAPGPRLPLCPPSPEQGHFLGPVLQGWEAQPIPCLH